MLLNKGCDITLPDADGLSSAHHAIRHNGSHIIQLMFEARREHFSQICIQYDKLGRSMLHHHVESVMCSTEVIRILREVGCYVDNLDAKGHCALSQYLMPFHLRIQYDVFRASL
jgi:ankyrin repeat protein